MSSGSETKLTEESLAQLNKDVIATKLTETAGLTTKPVDAFAKLQSLLRQKANQKTSGKSTRNLSPVPKFGSSSPCVKLEKSSSTSSRESVVYDSTEGSGTVLSSSEGSSAAEPKKITRRKILAKNKSTIVGTDDNETHPASSKMNVATLARIQKKRRLLQAAMDDRRKQQNKL